MGKYFNKKNQLWIILGVVAIVVITFIGMRRQANGGSITVPKKISIVKQAKSSGTYVWKTANGNAKNSIVNQVIVFQNGKGMTYRMMDNITLGKIAKMNKNQIINLAKSQDQKRLEKAPEAMKLVLNKRQYDGQFDWWKIFWDNAIYRDPSLGVVSNITNRPARLLSRNDTVTSKVTKFYDSTNTKHKDENTGSVYDSTQVKDEAESLDDFYPNSDDTDMAKKFGNAIMENSKKVKYVKPQQFTLKTTSKTDSSGNEIISQDVRIGMFDDTSDEKIFSQNWYKMVKNDPVLSKKLKDIIGSLQSINATMTKDDKVKDKSYKASHKLFTSDFYQQLTKGYFGLFPLGYTMSLTQTTAFDIYSGRFIGYVRSNGEYLVTLAQNSKQTAEFSK